MNEAKVIEGKSVPSSAGGLALTSEQIAGLNRRTDHCKRLLTLTIKSALTPNISPSVLEDLVQAMHKQLEELASANAAKMEPYHQLMESRALTEEAISASLTQDDTSELEYRAGVAELKDRLRASSSTGGELNTGGSTSCI